MAKKKSKKLSLDALQMLHYALNVEDVLFQYAKQGIFNKKENVKKKYRKKPKYKRDWKATNQKLINRGEFYLNPRFLDGWLEEIKEMNYGKVGQPYLYPNSLIEFLAVLHEKGFDVRALEGIVMALSKRLNNFPVISYTQISRRINSLDLKFDFEFQEKIIVGLDGSGNKVGKRGDWIRHVWKVKRGWIKVVILGTPDGKIVDVRVGNENLDERKAGRGMIRKNKKKIKKILADGLHDCEETFDLLDKLGIEAGIKIRKNASENGLGPRPKEVRLYKEIGHKKWVEEKQYGLRWPSTEGIFSAVKTIFGECISAKNKRNMYKEAKRKFWVYNKLLEVG